jgi:hypothetical protein
MPEVAPSARPCYRCGQEVRFWMRASRLPEAAGFVDFYRCLGCEALSTMNVAELPLTGGNSSEPPQPPTSLPNPGA